MNLNSVRPKLSNQPARPKVVVLGGGYAGVTFVDSLGEAPVDVTLIDKNPYHTQKTKLWKATVGRPEAQAVLQLPFEERLSGTDVRQGEVDEIRPEQQLVTLSDGREVPYDYLVVALGSKPNFYGNDDWAKHVLTSDQAQDSKRMREAVQNRATEALSNDDPLKFVVVGGGPTGVELAGVVPELVSQVSPALLDRLDVTLVNSRDKVLKGFPESYRDKATDGLLEKGINLKVGHRVENIEAGKVTLDSGESLEAAEILWGGGIEVPDVLDDLGGQQSRSGRVAVDEELKHPDHPEVYIIGDASVGQWQGRPIPADKRSAKQEAAYAAENILQTLEGDEPEAFVFTPRTEWRHFGPIRVDK